MKNLIFMMLATFAILSCKTKLSEPTPPPPPPPPTPVSAQIMASNMETIDSVVMSADRGVLMRNGTLMIMQDGQLVPLRQEMMLENGDKILLNGDVIRKDGSKTKIQEGMMMDKNGTLMDKNGEKIDTGR